MIPEWDDPCEWNPIAKTAASAMSLVVPGDCPNEAAFVVGADGQWRLCASCAALPEFKRFRVRTAVRGKGERGGGST